MPHDKLLDQVQGLLNSGKTEEAVDFLFGTYLQRHPQAQHIQDYRDRVRNKVRTEFGPLPEAEAKEKSKLLMYGFMSLISDSEGETGYNLVLLLLHLIRRGHHQAIKEIIEVLKLERASRNLGRRFS